MDKYEYRLKAEQIEKLAGKKDYETAAKIADTIDWRRVRSLDMLYVVSEVYEAMERYEDCMEILNIAYDRAPVGRMLLYKMTEIATKMHEFKEAINLYREFVKAAPHDQSRYILKYQIYRERGSSLEDQIQTLQEYKTHEYQERWAYELASLYAEAGMTEECVRECDELILWFSEGEYVTKAMELKMQYAPLTAAQQEKYDKAMQPEEEPHDYKKTEVAFHDDKFSTVNLQAELAANLDEILLDGDDGIDIPELPSDDEVKEEEPMEEVKTEESDDIELESLDLDIPEMEEPEEEPEKEPEDIELESLDLDIPEICLLYTSDYLQSVCEKLQWWSCAGRISSDTGYSLYTGAGGRYSWLKCVPGTDYRNHKRIHHHDCDRDDRADGFAWKYGRRGSRYV